MSNKIRAHFKREVDALLPILHRTYRLIGLFQNNRNERNEAALVAQLEQVGAQLAFFKSLLQAPKQAYFDAIVDHRLTIGDRLIALDTAIRAANSATPQSWPANTASPVSSAPRKQRNGFATRPCSESTAQTAPSTKSANAAPCAF